MQQKKKPVTLRISAEDLKFIDAAQHLARYSTRSSYMVECARLGIPVHLQKIAQRIRQLGMALKALQESDFGNDDEFDSAEHYQEEVAHAVTQLVETCELVNGALRDKDTYHIFCHDRGRALIC
tara:strand:+ start:43 stop:414 length:372 start_codon:yes stop_codon:yes gene_type:complete